MAKRILVVDDDIAILEMLSDILEMRGYNVTLIDNGLKAVEMIKRIYYDIILMDVDMPGVNGLDTFKVIKKISPLATVIMMSGSDVDDLVDRALKEGAYGMVHKPFNKEVLLKLIKDGTEKIKIFFVSNRKEDLTEFENLIVKTKIKNYDLFTTTDLSKVLDVSKNTNFYLGVINLDTIDESSFSMIEAIRESNCDMKIVIFTENVKKEYFEKFTTNEICIILTKSTNIKAIVSEVENKVSERKKLETKKILLVEDDKILLESLSLVIKEEGYDVIGKVSGNDAIEAFKNEVFDLVILDYRLPDMNGLEVAKNLRAINGDVLVILISGFADLNIAINAIRQNVSDFLIKPIDPKKLCDTIGRVISNKK